MEEHVTLIRPEDRPSGGRGLSPSLPTDLQDQVRGRVRILAILLFAGLIVSPVVYFGSWAIAILGRSPVPDEAYSSIWFVMMDVGAAVASLALWRAAGNQKFSASRLLTLGLIYEVIICFVIADATYWWEYNNHGLFPELTWIPAIVILFPLILPGPPRHMLIASIAAGAMAPLSLLGLDLMGKVPTSFDAYFESIVNSTFAVIFAFIGARMVYGLGQEVAKARELGSYRLQERLGHGGMGEVWRAQHRMLARPAAIKLIRPARSDGSVAAVSDEAVRRFEREAQVIASLRSPHTVNLFDFGVATDGAFYYVMELLEGLDANSLVRQFGPIPAERAIYVLRQVCHSLSEAESLSLVHRDIKPHNIFLCRQGEDFDFVKVLDFGLVKALDDSSSAAALTRENVVQGTPAFMAPEQAMGRPDIDGRADIYALGCVAYWLLTGQLVFAGDTPMSLLVDHVHTPPTPPSSRTELRIPEALDRLVLSCLAKEPAARPQTARELRRRLDDLLLPNSWTEERARDWWGKHFPSHSDRVMKPDLVAR